VDRRTAVILAVAVTAVVAISISAATLTSTVEPEGEGSDSGLPGEDSQFGLNLTDDNETESSDSDPSGPWRWVVLVFVALAVVSALFAPRQTAQVVAGFVGLVAVVWLLMLIDIEFALDGDLRPGTGGQNELQSPLVLALIAFASVAVLGVLLLSTRRGGDAVEGPQDDDEEETEEGDDTTALGSIAGRAADRIEADDSGDRAATNEVYRAWREMTAALDPDDAETVTPREFQHHAIAAGMSPDDVRELTRLFEQVRYGGEPVTADREERAVRVLRRIESTYGERS
jgi:hypothetical protein